MPFYDFGLEGYLSLFLYSSAIAAFLLSVCWRPICGVYFLVPLLPLQTVRYRLNDLPLGGSLIYVMALGIALGLLLKRQPLIPATPWNRLLGIYVPFTFVSLCLGSMYLGTSLPLLANDRRFADWCAYIIMPVIFFLVAASVTNVRQMRILIVLIGLGILMADRSYWAAVSGRDYSSYSHDLREGGAMGYAGSNGMAAFQAQFVTFLLGLASFEPRRILRLAYYGLAGFGALCLVYCFSRSGYLAIISGWLFIGVARQRKFLVLLAVFLMVWTSVVPNAVRMRVEMTYDDTGELDHSSATRLVLWADALKAAASNLALGTGFNTYAHMHRVDDYEDTHSIYIEVLEETGLVGLFLFLWLLAKSFRRAFGVFRYGEDAFLRGLGLGFAGWVICAAVVNAFGDRWTYVQVQGLFWVFMGLVARALLIRTAGEAAPAPVETLTSIGFSGDLRAARA